MKLRVVKKYLKIEVSRSNGLISSDSMEVFEYKERLANAKLSHLATMNTSKGSSAKLENLLKLVRPPGLTCAKYKIMAVYPETINSDWCEKETLEAGADYTIRNDFSVSRFAILANPSERS